MANETAILEILKLDLNLNLADHSELNELAENAQRFHFEKGEYIFSAGDNSAYYYLVESGRVVLSKESPTGKNFTYMIAVKGVPLNSIVCFKSRPHFFSARVAERTTVIAIPCNIFSQWVFNHPEVAIGILGTMGDLLDGAYTRLLDIIDKSAETRIMNTLAMLASRIGPELPLTNADIAELTGVSRETAARVISHLQNAGLISKSRGNITILDKVQFNELSSNPFFLL
ncbi:Crp/Fnr family transcriptional regulator [Maridesulfovibrio sp. FT414]|uniref:Crp/Fnr family transcriptional regulator n=1 Tax=Maridesulfovibrio sp. FT414 TaxID=2979469 RepID=UPI003D80A17B